MADASRSKINLNNIEADGGIRTVLPEQKALRRGNQPALLLRRYRLCGRTIAGAFSHLDLDEYEIIPIPHDEVNLMVSAAVVFKQGLKAAPLKITLGSRLRVSTDLRCAHTNRLIKLRRCRGQGP